MKKNTHVSFTPAEFGIAILGILALAILAINLLKYPLLQRFNFLPLALLLVDFLIARKVYQVNRDIEKNTQPDLSLAKKDPEERYQQVCTFLRVCRYTEWETIFNYLDLSEQLKYPVDPELVYNGISSIKMIDLIEIENNQITWNPIHVARAARLIAEFLENQQGDTVTREIDLEWIQGRFMILKKNASGKTGYTPMMNIFRSEKPVAALLDTLKIH